MKSQTPQKLSLNVVIAVDAKQGPHHEIHTADIVVDKKTGLMLKNRFGDCDKTLARALLDLGMCKRLWPEE